MSLVTSTQNDEIEKLIKREDQIDEKIRKRKRKPRRKRKKFIKFFDAVYKDKFVVPYPNRLYFEIQQKSLWVLLLGVFIAGSFLADNPILATIIFVIVLANYFAIVRSYKEMARRRFMRGICDNEDTLNEFLMSINAPKNLYAGQGREEPCEWINDIVEKFWPYINQIIQSEIDKKGFSHEGINVGRGHRVYFESFTLGDKPPKITYIGVNKKTTRADQMIITMKCLYFGNCLIGFSYKTLGLLKAKVGVKDVYFRGNAQLVLRPLVNVPPFTGGLSFAFYEPPIIDYDGVNLANLADNKLIKNFLINTITSFLVLPNKLYFPLLPDPVIKKDLKLQAPIGLCYMQIIEAENLPRMDITRYIILPGLADPFCRVQIGQFRYETEIIFNSINPVWKQTFAAPVLDFDDDVQISVFDKDQITADDFMGSIRFKLIHVYQEKRFNGKDKWLPLGRSQSGQFHFRIAVFRLCSKAHLIPLTMADIEKTRYKFPVGILSTYIYYARFSTSKMPSEAKIIELRFGKQTFYTNKASPTGEVMFWEEAAYFTCSDPTNDSLSVQIINPKKKKNRSAKETERKKDVFGSCKVALMQVIRAYEKDQSGKMVLDQEFPLEMNSEAVDEEGNMIEGHIKLFLQFKVAKSKHVIGNLMEKESDTKQQNPLVSEAAVGRNDVQINVSNNEKEEAKQL